jgi:hypothetical protein
LTGQTPTEFGFVFRCTRPCLALRIRIIVLGQFFDAGEKIAARTGVSSERNGRRPILGTDWPITSPDVDEFEGKRNSRQDQQPLSAM